MAGEDVAELGRGHRRQWRASEVSKVEVVWRHCKDIEESEIEMQRGPWIEGYGLYICADLGGRKLVIRRNIDVNLVVIWGWIS